MGVDAEPPTGAPADAARGAVVGGDGWLGADGAPAPCARVQGTPGPWASRELLAPTPEPPLHRPWPRCSCAAASAAISSSAATGGAFGGVERSAFARFTAGLLVLVGFIRVLVGFISGILFRNLHGSSARFCSANSGAICAVFRFLAGFFIFFIFLING